MAPGRGGAGGVGAVVEEGQLLHVQRGEDPGRGVEGRAAKAAGTKLRLSA